MADKEDKGREIEEAEALSPAKETEIETNEPLPEKAKSSSLKDSIRYGGVNTQEDSLRRGLIALLCIFIVLSSFGLYFSIQGIIDRWIIYQYVPIVETGYYIAIIGLCIYLVRSYLLRR